MFEFTTTQNTVGAMWSSDVRIILDEGDFRTIWTIYKGHFAVKERFKTLITRINNATQNIA